MVSVVIPVYNVENYIKQCLDSVFRQTYKNIEVIVINDGSQDRSNEIIKEYENKDIKLIYIEQENKGVAEARNTGLTYVTGEYVVFIDPDDYIEDSYIEDMYNIAVLNNCDVVICGYSEFYDSKLNRKNIIKHDICENYLYSGKEVSEMMLELKVKGYLWNKLFRNSSKFKENIRFENNKKIEDYFPVFKTISESEKISFIEKSLYNYRQREGSLVNSTNFQLVDDFFHACHNIIDYSESKNKDKKKIEFFKENCFSLTMLNYISLNLNGGTKIYEDFKKLGYSIYEPTMYQLIKSIDINIKLKLLIIMFKLKILHVFLKVKGRKL